MNSELGTMYLEGRGIMEGSGFVLLERYEVSTAVVV
jgi:hypothetical protein